MNQTPTPSSPPDDGKHDCPGPACQARLPVQILACRRHWGQVPKDLQRAVYRAWRSGDAAAHAKARAAAAAQMKP